MPPSPHSPREAIICRVVARYAAVPYCVLDHLFGGSCAMAVRKLAEPDDPKRPPLVRRHVKAIGAGAHKHSYIQLSPAACRRFGLSAKRSEPFGPAALSFHLGIAVFCFLTSYLRHRLNREELLPLLGAATPRANVPHVLTTEGGYPAVLRVYQALAPLKTCLNHLEALAEDFARRPVLAQWTSERDYGLAVLCTTRKQLAAMREALDKSGLRSRLLVVCDLGPTAETIGEILSGRIP